MNRREFVLAGISTAALGAALHARAAEQASPAKPAAGAGPSPALVDAAFACVKVGQACEQHCLTLLGKGDTSLAECAASVGEMLVLCDALTRLAAQDSRHLRALAGVCGRACRDCEKACRKHEAHHAICKQCAEACAACASQCEKIQA